MSWVRPDIAGALAPQIEAQALPPDRAVPPRYQWRDVLGRGRTAVTWRVFDSALHRPVAMKVLMCTEAAAVARFRSEAQVLSQLEHPGIVPVYDVGVLADGRPFYTMRCVQGRTLTEFVSAVHSAGSEPEHGTRLRPVARRIIEAIAYAHGRGVVHRDLNPDNVLVGPYGDVVVIDWGFAKVVEHGGHRSAVGRSDEAITCIGDVVGTPNWMAPEQALGHSDHVGPWTDVFVLGSLLYYIHTGALAYDEPSDSRVLAQVLRGAPVAAQGGEPLSASLRRVIQRAMNATPDARYADAGQLLAAMSPRPRRMAAVVRVGLPTGTGFRNQLLNVGEDLTVSTLQRLMAERVGTVPPEQAALICVQGARVQLRCPPGVDFRYRDPSGSGQMEVLPPGSSQVVSQGTEGHVAFEHHTVLFQIGAVDFGQSGGPA